MQKRLLQRLDDIARSLELSGKALTLIGLGSVGLELERLDEHSDLDFFAIVDDGQKTFFLENLTWLTAHAPIAYAVRNTADGFKLLYTDGIFCEFAVFEHHELSSIPFAAGRIVWKAAHIPDTIAQPARKLASSEFNLEWNLGEALTNLYIGLKRLARGEKLSASRFVQQYALDRILELAEYLEPAQPQALPDPFNRERRLEQRFPRFANHLQEFVQGYDRTAESAQAMLSWLETHFSINAGMARAIREQIQLLLAVVPNEKNLP
jgi:hypothetical protein